MKKRILTLILAICMMLTVMVGCNGGGTESSVPSDNSDVISDNTGVSTEPSADNTTEATGDATGETTEDPTGDPTGETTEATGDADTTVDAGSTTTTTNSGGQSSTSTNTTTGNKTSADKTTANQTTGNKTSADKTTTNKTSGNKTTNKTTTGQTTAATTKATFTTQAQSNKFPGRVTDLKGRTIVFNTYPNSSDPNDPAYKERQAFLKSIGETYNCTITEYTRYNESGGDNTITTSVLAGDPLVDIWTQNGATEIIPHYKAGLLQDLSKWKTIDFERTENPWDKSIQQFYINGSYYGVTILQSQAAQYANIATVMFFNPKLLKQYGVTEDLFALQESGNWTWDKFEEICRKFNSNAGSSGKTAYYDSDLNLYQALLTTYGTDWIVKKDGVMTFNGNDTKAQAALTRYKGWATDGTIKVLGSMPLVSSMTTPQYNFYTGQSAFTVALHTNLEWGMMQGGQTTQDVKDNYGILLLPKEKASDEYTAAVESGQLGGYSIPYGVKAANEVLTIMDVMFSHEGEDDGKDPTEEFLANKTDKWLNNATGAQSRKTVARLHKLFLSGKQTYTDNWIAGYTTPNIGTDVTNGWYSHVVKIANGTEAMGTALSSVTNTYNNTLKNFLSER